MMVTAFRERMNHLYGKSGLSSIQSFADMCGVSRQSMQYYLDGKRMPDSEGLLKLCNACSVSADWLLGLSDIRSLSPEIQSIAQYTKLSEKAIETLNEWSMYKDYRKCYSDVLSNLIVNEFFETLLSEYLSLQDLIHGKFFDSEKKYTIDDIEYEFNKGEILLGKDNVTISCGKAIKLLCNEIGAKMSEICLVELYRYAGTMAETE